MQISPTNDEIDAFIAEVQKKHPALVKLEITGRSRERRPIYSLRITDPGADDRDKQHAVVTAGQHGNEESGRAIALALIEWLVSRSAEATRRKQVICVMPNVSPDAAARDEYLPPSGKNPNRYGTRSPESRAVEDVLHRYMPEAFVDLHSCGYTGCGNDIVLLPKVKEYTEDGNILHEIALRMADAGEKTGIPHTVQSLAWDGWEGKAVDLAYRRYKSLSILTESAESNDHSYPLGQRARCGLTRIKTLLEYGNSQHAKSAYGGYPCNLLCGSFCLGITAIGGTQHERRLSRCAAWEKARFFKRLKCEIPQEEKFKRIEMIYTGGILKNGVGVQLAVNGTKAITALRIKGPGGRILPGKNARSWTAAGNTYIIIPITKLRKGRYLLEIRFRSL